MQDYSKLTRAELVERLQSLETAFSTPTGPTTSEATERLRAILETAVEGIITIDEQGLIESMNPAAEKLFGYTVEEVLGENVSVLMPSPYREEHDGYLERYLRTGEARIIGIGREVTGQRRDGSVFPMDLAVSEIRLGARRLFTGFVRDISERKVAEEKLAGLARSLAEKNKELETVVYVASHDLRSPLVNIQGFSKELGHACELLRERLVKSPGVAGSTSELNEVEPLLNQDIPEALEYIQAGVKRMDTLLSGFLRFSRLGRAALKIEPLEMNALLAGIVQSMEFQIKQSGTAVRVGALPECLGDAVQIARVFSNLLDNALKYLDPKRKGEISVSGRTEQGRAIYSVRDNGIGIAPAHQEKVFEIFHRLDPAHGEGEGLGLTIAQRILERHNGRIWVESAPGGGSTFYVSLPSPRQ